MASVLRQAFVEYEGLYTPEAYAATVSTPDRIRARIGEGAVWLAFLDGDLAGTVSAFLQPEGVYIRSMAVLPASRGHGIGRLLLAEVESFAVASHQGRLFLRTTPFLDRAIRLYVASGFKRTHAGPHDLLGTPLFTMEKMLS